MIINRFAALKIVLRFLISSFFIFDNFIKITLRCYVDLLNDAFKYIYDTKRKFILAISPEPKRCLVFLLANLIMILVSTAINTIIHPALIERVHKAQ
jgi:hypothetical protein